MLIYLHIPFCDSLCHYCSFNSYVDKFDLKKNYMTQVVQHLTSELLKFGPKKNSIKSLFIGGGTPSTITPSLYENFFELLSPYLDKYSEITVEANPNSASLEWLSGMRDSGVNRVSFGVQSFNELKLKFLGRNHNKNSAIKAVESAYMLGFKNISIDLIYGTKLDDKKLLLNDLDIAFSLPINHLSAYSLTIEENTKFFETPNASKDSIKLARFFTKEIVDRGLPQYEISNFGTYKSVHNLGYWEYDNYIGIGAGAIGFLNNQRFYTTKAIEEFIANPKSIEIENLSIEDMHLEKIFLGLRSEVGVYMSEFNEKEIKNVNILLEDGKLRLLDAKVYNSDFFLSDELALFITK